MKLLAILLCTQLTCAMMPAEAASDPAAMAAADREAIVHLATEATLSRLKLAPGTVHLVADRWRRQGDWVFMTSTLRDASGRRFDYAGTDQAEAAREGGKSTLCATLARRENGQWKLIDIAVGPTDVAWEGWPREHQAPAELFQ